ncbi:MAG TPA: TonB-dependent receptor [Bacteroidales bacterium]|jgi:vitamin B12 transporter|nr:TonB-dependent receptor [Bacteroidales bacterium]
MNTTPIKVGSLLITLLIGFNLNAQYIISGSVYDESGTPQIGANVYLKGTYIGATTGLDGRFHLNSKSNEKATLVVSYIGFESYEQEVMPGKSDSIRIKLLLQTDQLEEVVISAGTFEAGDKKRAVVLNAIDVATTANSDGDIYSALSSFPGTQKQGETGKIIVRGGDSHETNTYIDGMLVSSPYVSSMPDLPARGRFSPFMFNGIMFSTGGYSAEYGQALSSVLELKTPGLFDETVTSVSLMNVGAGLSHTNRNPRSAYSIEGFYSNLAPFFFLAQHDLDWIKVPESYSGNMSHRAKIGKTGMIKTNANYSWSNSSLNYPSNMYEFDKVELTNNNLFAASTYNTELSDKWILKTGVAYNANTDQTDVNSISLDDKITTLHARLGLNNYTSKNITLKMGSELYMLDHNFNFRDTELVEEHNMGINSLLLSAYFEGDIKLTRRFAMRFGGRGEYSDLTNTCKVAPRASMAYKVDKFSQFSVATGIYYQQARPEYLRYNGSLKFERAEHYIFNYQYQHNKRTFRTEIYHKNYNDLVTYTPGEFAEYEKLANHGQGYARGVDLFWRDNKTLKFTDYWISYSYIDTKRKYKDYPIAATPDFVSGHNLTLVYKRWINKITSQVSLSYSYSSGRPYDNPNKSDFMSELTRANHDISGNFSYITNIFGYFTVLHISVSNLLGLEKIYSYRYTENPDSPGTFQSTPLISGTRRTIIIGLFISIN